MDTRTHAEFACVIYDALPRAAQDFLRLSDLELRHWARVPDEQDHDNLLRTGCETGVECWAHSYKIGSDGQLIGGSCPDVIASAPRECVTAAREGRFDDARETMVKAFSHYAVDLSTPWHLTRELSPEDHKAGEKTLRKLPMPDPVRATPLTDPKSLFRSCVAHAHATRDAYVPRLKSGKDLTGPLGHQILADAAGFGLTVAHYIWRYLERA